MPVQRDLIVNLVSLISDTIKMMILVIDLLAHGRSNFVDTLGAVAQSLPGKH